MAFPRNAIYVENAERSRMERAEGALSFGTFIFCLKKNKKTKKAMLKTLPFINSYKM